MTLWHWDKSLRQSGITKITKDNEDNEKLIKKLILTVGKITTKITNRKWVDSWIAKNFFNR